ncbi:hypothetical protein PanWU01x14_067080 [Parasponia andersonii]|uniref:Uncharacterized protein n=1 Tax=Parasponia andersonii TaxID=3476 RepID=A0A2P5DGC0_PARAD|nr:hypothetical protein PanWU01x14_067080 [Parasponia andersonii]
MTRARPIIVKQKYQERTVGTRLLRKIKIVIKTRKKGQFLPLKNLHQTK